MHSFIHTFCAYPQTFRTSSSGGWWISRGTGVRAWISNSAGQPRAVAVRSDVSTAFQQDDPRFLCMIGGC